MTNADRLKQSFAHYRQPQTNFINAGRHAYRLGVYLQSNPYKEQPWRDWWDKGYRLERRKVEGPRRTDGAATGRSTAQRPNYIERDKPRSGKPVKTPYMHRTKTEGAPVISLGRIERFNAKYRTVA